MSDGSDGTVTGRHAPTSRDRNARAALVVCIGAAVTAALWLGLAAQQPVSGSRLLESVILAGIVGWAIRTAQAARRQALEVASISRSLALEHSGARPAAPSDQSLATTLHDTGTHLTAVIENLRAGIVVQDDNGRVVLVNTLFCRMFDLPFTPEDIPALPAGALLRDAAARIAEPPAFVQRMRNGMPGTGARAEGLTLRDGRSLECDSVPLLADGQPRGRLLIFRDNTERAAAAAAIQASEERMRMLVEHTPAAVAVLDRDLRYVVTSRRWLLDYHLPAEGVIGQHHYELFPDLPDRWKQIHKRGLAGEVMRCDEDPFPRADGSVEWLTWEMRPWRNNAGEIGGIVFFTEVITSRKLLEEAVRQSDDRLRLLIEGLRDSAVVMLDAGGRVATWNSGAQKIEGHSADEIIGMHFRCFCTPEDQASELPERALHMAAATGQFEDDGWRVRSDGSRFWANVLLTPFHDQAGGLVGFSKITRDNTERRRAADTLRESDERFRCAFDDAPIGIALVSRDGLCLSVNARLADMLGYGREQLAGTSFSALAHPEDRDADGPLMLRLTAGEIGTYQCEKRCVHRDGRTVRAMLHVSCVRPVGAAPGCLVVQVHDITAQKAMEAEFERARDLAIESARLKSEFLANMSHEIRTPMTGVIGMAGLLLETELNEDQRDFAASIQSSGEELLTIINDILDLSKVEAGKLDIEVVDFDLDVALKSVVKMFARAAAQKQVQLGSSIDPRVPLKLRGDPGRLKQILTNLVGNAVKFTAAGAVGVRIETEAHAEGRVTLRVSVRDTGIGIPTEVQGRLFNAFSQADGSTTRRFGGTGLGLAICRQLVTMMGGRIGVDSRAGEGATFWFTIVLETQAVRTDTAARRTDLAGLRVIIVADSERDRALLHSYVGLWAMRGTAAASSADALLMMRAAVERDERFDIAMIDQAMPGMDGFELAAAIQSEPALAATRLLLMPADASRAHSRAAREAGIDACLVKPVQPSELHECLAAMMDARHDGLTGAGPAPAAAPQAPGALRVLVAEDQAVNRKLIVHQLKRLGYEADVVENGAEAVDAMSRRRFALVLMDCQMPLLDGFGATAAIRAQERGLRHTPIVALTAGAMVGERARCLEAGMDDYLSKPVAIEGLRETLERWLLTAAPAGLMTAAGDPAS